MLSRRSFLSPRSLAAAVQALLSADDSGHVAAEAPAGLDHYFQSPLYGYAFIQDLPWDIVAAEAERLGIAMAGRSKGAVVRDVLATRETGYGF